MSFRLQGDEAVQFTCLRLERDPAPAVVAKPLLLEGMLAFMARLTGLATGPAAMLLSADERNVIEFMARHVDIQNLSEGKRWAEACECERSDFQTGRELRPPFVAVQVIADRELIVRRTTRRRERASERQVRLC